MTTYLSRRAMLFAGGATGAAWLLTAVPSVARRPTLLEMRVTELERVLGRVYVDGIPLLGPATTSIYLASVSGAP